MKVCFFSNYLTHHQLPFCLEMVALTEGDFIFVETEQLPWERRNMGYAQLGKQNDFVLSIQEGTKQQQMAVKIAQEADVVIIGSAPDKYIRHRLKENKLTFRYSERIFKKGYVDLLRQVKYALKTLPYGSKNLYYLLSSAYGAHDYVRCGAKTSKMFKWGYFPEHIHRENKALLFEKKKKKSILWVGRLLDWKHPEAALEMAMQLKKEGYDFYLNIIGSGPMKHALQAQILKHGLTERVSLLGAMPPEEVRRHMEESEIFLFTSDYNEGWGAVANEAMSSGCAVVASHACGSIPFMVKHGENGLIYESGNISQLCEFTKDLLQSPEITRRLAENALAIMDNVWNAKVAAKRLLEACNRFAKEGILLAAEVEGPMSAAKPIRQDEMYRCLMDEEGEKL